MNYVMLPLTKGHLSNNYKLFGRRSVLIRGGLLYTKMCMGVVFKIGLTVPVLQYRPSLIMPPYLSRNCGRIREVAFGEREK